MFDFLKREAYVLCFCVLSTNPLNISFRRALVGDKLRMWLELVALLVNVNLTDPEDSWEWELVKTVLSVKLYNDLMIVEQVLVASPIWKPKIPLRIKIFMCTLQKVLLS